MHHRPRKRFGQNFLQSQSIISSIIEALCPQPTDIVVEIGPGFGALTRPLLQRVDRLSAIEIDRDLCKHLHTLPSAHQEFTLISGDALSYDYQQFGKNIRLIGNLPYNISTPLLFHLLQFADCIQDMHFMLQKEVVNRLVAIPATKDFGRLSVMIQYYCAVESILDVPATAFYPQPKVNSAVVRIVPYRVSPWPVLARAKLEHLVACAFRMRRKTLANNLKPLLSIEQMRSVGIDPGLRPEQLSVAQYGLLTTLIPDQIDTGAHHVLPRRKEIRAQQKN